MIDFTNFEKISDETYVWRNFLGDELTDILFEESLSISNSTNEDNRKTGHVREDRHDRVQLLHGAVDSRVVDIINDFFKDSGFEVKNFLHWHNPADIWFPMHRDDANPDPHPFKKSWGGVIYLSEMDGGELVYPTNNTWFKPHKGDLVLHTSSLIHGAAAVKGDNKRFITFVVYDKSKPVSLEDKRSPEEIAISTMRDVRNSKDWLETDLGKSWLAYEDENWNKELSKP